MPPSTVADALAAALAHDPARPLVTWLGPDGARTELSVRTFENNVAKAANLLRDDADLGEGGGRSGTVVLAIPLHWQTSVWLGACALVGATAWVDGDPADPACDLAVVGPDSLDRTGAPLTLATSLHPFGLPFTTPLPAGVLDAAVEVRAHGDRFTPSRAATPDDAWLRLGGSVLTQGRSFAAAAEVAETAGLAPGGRLLVRRTTVDRDAVLALLAVPLALDAAVVLLDDGSTDDAALDAVADRERCTAVLR